MKNQASRPQSDDSRENARAEAIRVGRMPVVTRGQKVWVWDCGRWNKAIVRRCLPGGCYWVEKCSYPGNGDKCTVSANTFGGLCNVK